MPDSELRARLFNEVPKDVPVVHVEVLDEWVTGKKSEVFQGVVGRFSDSHRQRR